MGKKLETLKTRDEYAEFADKADKLIRDVVHQALRRQAQPRSVGRREIAPFEILLMGGDDLMLVTAGDLAVSVALDIVDSYERHALHDLTLSLGLVLTHARFPIYAMHDLAAALLKSAKKVGGSALDFAVITAVGSRDLEWLRDEALTDRSFALKPPKDWRYRLTQRPYSLADFAKLCYHARQLQAVRFPRSQLQAMYDGLFVSSLEASLRTITAVGRASTRHSQKLRAFFEDFGGDFGSLPYTAPPWRAESSDKCLKPDDRPQGQCFSTALSDLVEIYRFVPALEKGESNVSDD